MWLLRDLALIFGGALLGAVMTICVGIHREGLYRRMLPTFPAPIPLRRIQ